MKLNKFQILLFVLILFSLFIRLIKPTNLSLFGDEIDVGYQAFSLLTTAHDYKGNFLPTYIQSLAESRAPLLIYSSIPGIFIFGLNELGVRFAPIVLGVFSIFLFYKLIFLLSNSHRLAFLSTFVLSFSPWHFHYSRTAFESTLLLSLLLLGTYYFYKFIKFYKNKFLYFSIIAFSLTFYTYSTANIFTPLLVLYLIFSNINFIKTYFNPKLIFYAIFLGLIFVLPITYQILFGPAANRFSSINIFNNQFTIDSIINKRTIFSAGNQNTERIFHNKLISFSQEIFKNYLNSFSLNFLFINGDTLNLRHSIPGTGLIFISFLPFLVLGFVFLKRNNQLNKLMLFWLFISPLPASLTLNGGTHATRLFPLIIPISYFISLGINKTISAKYSKLIFFSLTITLIIEVSLYSHEYFVHYPKDSFLVWNRGYQEIFQNIPPNYNRLFVSNAKYNSLLPFLFYQKYSPFQFINSQVKDSGDTFNLNHRITFINHWENIDHLQEISQNSLTGDVFVLFQGNDIPGDMDFSKNQLTGFNTIKTIFNPNQTIFAQIIQKQ